VQLAFSLRRYRADGLTTPRSSNVIGAILGGGASTRMGTDKATLELDGIAMAVHVAQALSSAGARRVVLIGGDPSWSNQLGLAQIPDRWPGQGPLGGLVTALLDAPNSSDGAETVLVVVACDQPWITSGALRSLVDGLLGRADAMAAAAIDDDRRRNPFPSAWRVTAASAVSSLFEMGSRRATDAFACVDVVDVPTESALIRDADTPEDLNP
jgi:molybdenum cofactor guanylyltransferase